MSRNLVALLEGTTAERLALQELRSMTSDGLDVRLIADILAKAHSIMRRLGLDPADTTPIEVYSALINAVRTEQWLSLLGEADYILLDIDGQVISFNPIDVIDNFHHQLPIEKRKTSAAKKGLGWEITRRYRENSNVDSKKVNQVAEQADWPTEEPLFCRLVFDKPSILVVGDIASEALITLDDNNSSITGTKRNRKIELSLGARISCQGGHVQDAAGSAANLAVAMSKLGVQPTLMSWLGNDSVGRQSLTFLRQFGIDMSGVVMGRQSRTNYHYVLRHGAERTILASYENFDYDWHNPVCQPDWLVLSMISDQSWDLHEAMLDYLDNNSEVKLAFQPGAVHLKWGIEKLARVYGRSEVVIMNIDEAMLVTGRKARNAPALLRAISKLGAKMVILTDGPNGSYAFDGHEVLEIPSYPDPEKPVDRTGAGDAFAATLIAELSKGKSLGEALLRAPINSMSVVQQIGSQSGLLESKEIENYLDLKPENYAVKSTKNN